MTGYTPFSEFEKNPFLEKSSRIPCKEATPTVDPFSPLDFNFGLMGQVSGWLRPEDGDFSPVQISSYNTVTVPSGKGYIIDPVVGIKEVTWESASLVLTGISASWITTIAVSASGQVVQLDGYINSNWARTHIILGTVTHISDFIDAVQMTPSIWGAIPYAAYDLMMANRNLVFNGGEVTPNRLNKLSLNIAARNMFFYGASMNNISNPNLVSQSQQVRIMFHLVTGNSDVGDLTPNIPVSQFNPGGANLIQDVPGTGNAATAFRLYQFADRYVLLYGQNVYTSLQQCVSSVFNEEVYYPQKMKLGKLLAIICVRSGATDLNNPADAVIITQNGGGSTNSTTSNNASVTPRIWSWVGDGESTDFSLPGADVADPLFYDSAAETNSVPGEYNVLKPGIDFLIVMGDTPADTQIRFQSAPEEGVKGFTILRGYALPSIGNPPVTSLRIPIVSVTDFAYLVTKNAEFALIRTLADDTTTITIRSNDNDDLDMQDGSYFSVCQRGEGQAQIVVDVGSTLIVPIGYLPYTRAKGSTISATCEYADGNIWVVSGDLAEEP